MKRILNLLVLLTLTFLPIKSQDLIILKNGEDIKSKVEEIDAKTVRYRKHSNLNGPLYNIEIKEVLMILYENGTKDVFNTDDGTSKERKSHEIEFKHFNFRVSSKSYFGNSIYLVNNIGARWYPKLDSPFFLEANVGISKGFYSYYYYPDDLSFSPEISFGVPVYRLKSGSSIGSLVLDVQYIRGYKKRADFEADIEYVLPGLHLEHRYRDFIAMLGLHPTIKRQSMPEDLDFRFEGISLLVGFGFVL